MLNQDPILWTLVTACTFVSLKIVFRAVGMYSNIILWFPTSEFNWLTTGPFIWAAGFYCTKENLLRVMRAARQRHTQNTGLHTHTHIYTMSTWGSKRAMTKKATFVLDLKNQVGFRLGGKAEGRWRWWEQCVRQLSLPLCLCLSCLEF